MNYTREYGWFYRAPNNRTPSWTGVDFLYQFLVDNQSVGPFGSVCEKSDVQMGDIIQLLNEDGRYYHSLFVVEEYPVIRVAAHSMYAWNRPLSSYLYRGIRCIHIDGVRVW